MLRNSRRPEFPVFAMVGVCVFVVTTGQQHIVKTNKQTNKFRSVCSLMMIFLGAISPIWGSHLAGFMLGDFL